jgi:hypothetical protein
MIKPKSTKKDYESSFEHKLVIFIGAPQRYLKMSENCLLQAANLHKGFLNEHYFGTGH